METSTNSRSTSKASSTMKSNIVYVSVNDSDYSVEEPEG